MTNKKSWIFHGEELTESTDILENPARGWYGIYTFPVQEQIDPEEMESERGRVAGAGAAGYL